MNKIEANKLAGQVASCFATYFQNNYRVHPGKHWRERQPEDADMVARNTINASCKVGKSTDKKRGTFSFRVDVLAIEPNFVEPQFSIPFIDGELRKLLGERVQAVMQQVDLRGGQLYMSYRAEDTDQYYHFNFRLK